MSDIEDKIKKALEGEANKDPYVFDNSRPEIAERIEKVIVPALKGMTIQEMHTLCLYITGMIIISQKSATDGLRIASWLLGQVTDASYSVLNHTFGPEEIQKAALDALMEKIKKGKEDEQTED